MVRWFSAWNDRREERWLEEMAREGWHLRSGPFPCAFGGWQYFRTASPDAPEIHPDAASRAGKYRRLLAIAALLAVTTTGANLPAVSTSRPDRGPTRSSSGLGARASG